MTLFYISNPIQYLNLNTTKTTLLTFMQDMRSTGRSQIKIQGVEMGRIRVGFRDQLGM